MNSSLAFVSYPTRPMAMWLPRTKIVVALVAAIAIIISAFSIVPDTTRFHPMQSAFYEVQWVAGRPVNITESGNGSIPGVDLTVLRHTTGTQALFRINSPESPTVYQFDSSIPEGHTGHVQADGSVVILDAVGNQVGVISVPWAYDANGVAVPTGYVVSGTTLIQTVDHHGAAYPVVADPLILIRVIQVSHRVYTTCTRTGCVSVLTPVVTYVWRNVVVAFGSSYFGIGGRSGDPRARPTNKCNMRNRTGC